jgi:membrane protein DedA with SNARE-associated domain
VPSTRTTAVEHFLSSWGYVALILFTIAEAACIPIPSEVTLGFAGYLASTGKLEIAAVIIVATLGELAGAFIAYAVGRTGGRALVERLGRYVLLTKSDIDRAERWFGRFGEPTVLIARVLPIVRTFVSLPAGVAEMNVVRFGMFTFLGSAAWCTALAVTGYELGGSWHSITKGFSAAGYVLAGMAVVAIAAFVLHRLAVVRRERAAGNVIEP